MSSSSLPPSLLQRRNSANGGLCGKSGGFVVGFFAFIAVLYYVNNAYQILFMNQRARLLSRVGEIFSSAAQNTTTTLAGIKKSSSLLATQNEDKMNPSDFAWVKRCSEAFLQRDEDGLSSASSTEMMTCELFSRTARENIGAFSSNRYFHVSFLGGNRGTRNGRVQLKTFMPKYVYRDAMAKYTEKNVKEISKMSAIARRGILSERRSFFLRKRSADGAERRKKAKNARRLIASSEKKVDDKNKKNKKEKLRRIIGTHHKTGTALMRDVFDSISREFEYNFFNLRVYEDYPYLQPGNLSSIIDEADVILDYHFSKPIPSYFINAEDWYSSDRRVRRFNKQQRECQSLASYYQGSYRIIHLIRDPRDALVSGVLYHMQNPEDESWLREIRVGDELFNSTSSSSYVQSIRRLKNPVDALAAELKIADDELRMLGLAAQDCEIDIRAMNVRLESFFDELDDILRFLEFPEEDIEEMVRVANLHNAKTWEKNETEHHVHFTSENPDRHKYIEAMYEEGFVNKTVSYLRYALGYTNNASSDAFPTFANER
ncbi:unnamed protein product [Bathycoccus prasinos]